MRFTIPIFLILFSFTVYAQSETWTGDYFLKWECESHQIEYKLSLNQDGTYELNTFTTERSSTSDVLHQTDNGNWRMKDDVLNFSSKGEKDFDEEYTADLNGSIARVFPKSPAEEADEKEQHVLIFDTSKIYCIEGLEFIKL